jgi:hypothetical protein
VEMCSATAVKNSHRKLDPAIHNGFRWVVCVPRVSGDIYSYCHSVYIASLFFLLYSTYRNYVLLLARSYSFVYCNYLTSCWKLLSHPGGKFSHSSCPATCQDLDCHWNQTYRPSDYKLNSSTLTQIQQRWPYCYACILGSSEYFHFTHWSFSTETEQTWNLGLLFKVSDFWGECPNLALILSSHSTVSTRHFDLSLVLSNNGPCLF